MITPIITKIITAMITSAIGVPQPPITDGMWNPDATLNFTGTYYASESIPDWS